MPPAPRFEAASSACWMAALSSATPSPVALTVTAFGSSGAVR